MPNIQWEELSKIRHELAGAHGKLMKLDLTIRSWHANHNTASVVDDSSKQVELIRDKVWEIIDDIDDFIIQHETEDL